jgi:AmmeMemoRadiSam system protein A
MVEPLSKNDQKILLAVARQAIVHVTQGRTSDNLDLASFPRVLTERGASFVTLHRKDNGQLRGCIGVLEAYQPLVQDVQDHAIAAALEDYRFPPVKFQEVQDLKIEISRLTAATKVKYTSPLALPALLRPGVDGVILRDGFHKATFLPQVWEQLPDPEDFLGQLCQKMGANRDCWKKKILEVAIYQVEEFHE